MEKHKQIKRNHHYVWSFYLKSWAKGNNVFYISQRGKVACDSIKGLAKETDFYKINPLKTEDIDFIKCFSSKSKQFLQDIHLSHLNRSIDISDVSHYISQSGIDSKELNLIDKAIRHNSLEDLHSIYEDLAVNVVSALSRGNIGLLNSNENMFALCSYLGHQISRTQSFKEKALDASKMIPIIDKNHHLYLKLLEKNWWFISFMLGLNIGFSLYESKDRDNHVFIFNNTGLQFITSDNPIINIHSSLNDLSPGEVPTSADFYIPLSPNYAYMINNSSHYNQLSNSIDRDMVNILNRLIFKKSYKTVFGCSDVVLNDLIAHNKLVATKNKRG
jgi:hypothetical protein